MEEAGDVRQRAVISGLKEVAVKLMEEAGSTLKACKRSHCSGDV